MRTLVALGFVVALVVHVTGLLLCLVALRRDGASAGFLGLATVGVVIAYLA